MLDIEQMRGVQDKSFIRRWSLRQQAASRGKRDRQSSQNQG
jgi:hypothetical protein